MFDKKYGNLGLHPSIIKETNILSRIHHPNVIEAKKISVVDFPFFEIYIILELADFVIHINSFKYNL